MDIQYVAFTWSSTITEWFDLIEFHVLFFVSCSLDFESSNTFQEDHPYEMFNNENDMAYEHLLEFLRKHNRH